MKKILVIAAHPDDEVLGCGGTLARYSKNGSIIDVVFVSDGESSRECEQLESLILQRRDAAKKSAKILGINSLCFEDFPDNKLDTVSLLEITKTIEAYILKLQPDTVITHHGGDVNIDHQRVHQAVMVAARPQNHNPVKTLLFFEVPSSTEWQTSSAVKVFSPDYFVNISEEFEKKIEALRCYSEELRKWPHPRSLQGVEHLARWRGATIGVEAAEAFMLGRFIE